MKCPNCDEKLRVVHSYIAGSAGRTQRLVCPSCETVVTAAVVILNVDPVRFRGAAFVAKQLASGEDMVKVIEQVRDQ